ncbi:DNA-directed RNA polymerase specialized sigma24 family protein OS=Streptomyces chartreusis OX=1969 GN=CP983_31155 PE=4 SV=1 [Streptomyces chartreusis]
MREVLTAAGVQDADDALEEADAVPGQYALLDSPEFDPCSLQARPTDLMRRRQHLRAALAAGAALLVCGALLGLPGEGWAPDGPAAPSYAQNPAAEAALDPAQLTKVPELAWQSATRTDFSVWPARGDLTGDSALLRRALAVWARPGETVTVSATPGTPAGGPPGAPQLLYAGTVDTARVVILYDGLRVARYAEPTDGTAGAALDFSRVDGAGRAEASAVVLSRADGNVRYLLAPWVKDAAERDLLKPGAGAMDLGVREGITSPLSSPISQQTGACSSWNVLQVTDSTGTRLLTDLAELVPARLTTGRPGAAEDVTGARALHAWAPYSCWLGAMRSAGVRSVNAWSFAAQPLPDGTGTADWVCTRAETWRGGGERVLAQFRTPGSKLGAVAAKAQNVPACGARDPHVLAGVLWKAKAGGWYLLAAGTADTASITATGGVQGTARNNLLATEAKQGAQAKLKGTLNSGRVINGLQ